MGVGRAELGGGASMHHKIPPGVDLGLGAYIFLEGGGSPGNLETPLWLHPWTLTFYLVNKEYKIL